MMIISIPLALYILQSIFVIIPCDSLKDIMRYATIISFYLQVCLFENE